MIEPEDPALEDTLSFLTHLISKEIPFFRSRLDRVTGLKIVSPSACVVVVVWLVPCFLVNVRNIKVLGFFLTWRRSRRLGAVEPNSPFYLD